MTDATDDSTFSVEPATVDAGARTVDRAWTSASVAARHVAAQHAQPVDKWGVQPGAVAFRDRYVDTLTQVSAGLADMCADLAHLTGFLSTFNDRAAKADAEADEALTQDVGALDGPAADSPAPGTDAPFGS